MTFFWLLFWMLNDTPSVMFDPMSDWAIGLLVCIGLDVMGGIGKSASD